MTAAEDIADDWKDFDGLEVMTLQRQGGDGTEEVELSYVDDDGETQGAALKRQINRRDQLALGLASLTGAEVVIEVPVSIAGTIREGNILVDSDGANWNVRVAQLATLQTRWRCLCTKQET